MNWRSRLLFGVVSTSIASIALPASAQDGIEVITVTAAKRAQNVQDVPISLEVVGGQDLEKFNTGSLLELESQIPGLDVSTSNGGNRIALRGFGSTSNAAIDQTVALYKDGIFMGRSRQNQAPFFDVQRIEVLRGPQGALIGKNSAAGAVSIISNIPTQEFAASISASYLIDENGFDSFGFVNGAVTDELSARLAFKYLNSKGLLTNFATGKKEESVENKAVRLSLRFQPSTNFDMVTKFEYIRQDQTGHNFFGLPAGPGATWAGDWAIIKAAGGYTAPCLDGNGSDNKGPHVAHLAAGEQGGCFSDIEYYNAYDFSNTATVDFGDVTFVSVTGYDAFNSRLTSGGRHAGPTETVITDFIENFKQLSQEFRLLSPTEQFFEWIVGVYADTTTQNIWNYYHQAIAGTRDQVMHTDYNMTTYTYSAYATGTLNFTEDLRLIAGVRGTAVNKSGRFQLFGDSLLLGTYSDAPRGPFRDSFTDSTFDPSVTVQYDVMDDVMVYASFGRGSKGGTLQGTSRTVTPVDWRLKQEISTSYEIGAKTSWWDWLTFNVSAYYMTLKNFQVSQFIQLPGELFPSNRAANAARVVSQGVELNTTADFGQWIEGLRGSFTGAYTDAHYDDYPGAACTAKQPAPPCAQATNNIAGYPLQYTSVWKGSAELNYTRPIFEGLKLELSVSADMRSKYYFDTSNYSNAIGLQSGVTFLNMRVAIAESEGKWSLAFIGENMSDAWRGTQRYTFPGAPGTVDVFGATGGRKMAIQGTVKF